MLRLGTSTAQLYRLLDQTDYRKSVDQLLGLLGWQATPPPQSPH